MEPESLLHLPQVVALTSKPAPAVISAPRPADTFCDSCQAVEKVLHNALSLPAPPSPFSPRELATALYALRGYIKIDIDTPAELDALTRHPHFAEHAPLNPDEVDSLCERLSSGAGK